MHRSRLPAKSHIRQSHMPAATTKYRGEGGPDVERATAPRRPRPLTPPPFFLFALVLHACFRLSFEDAPTMLRSRPPSSPDWHSEPENDNATWPRLIPPRASQFQGSSSRRVLRAQAGQPQWMRPCCSALIMYVQACSGATGKRIHASHRRRNRYPWPSRNRPPDAELSGSRRVNARPRRCPRRGMGPRFRGNNLGSSRGRRAERCIS